MKMYSSEGVGVKVYSSEGGIVRVYSEDVQKGGIQ